MRAFPFLRTQSKRGITEIRGPYYTPVGPRYLRDVLETMGEYVDILKFAGGSFALMPRERIREILDVCHEFDVEVSTGGFIEHVLTEGSDVVDRYLAECRDLGFDIVEISSGFVIVPEDDLVRLAGRVRELGMKPKPEVGIQFGAGGAGAIEEEVRDVGSAIRLARRYLDAGAELVMIESEGITEGVKAWRTDVVTRIVSELGLARVMFEAADPPVFQWYVKTYGPEVNLFVDHSQIVQLQCLRSGLWGTQDVWGRIHSYTAPEPERPAAAAPARRSARGGRGPRPSR